MHLKLKAVSEQHGRLYIGLVASGHEPLTRESIAQLTSQVTGEGGLGPFKLLPCCLLVDNLECPKLLTLVVPYPSVSITVTIQSFVNQEHSDTKDMVFQQVLTAERIQELLNSGRLLHRRTRKLMTSFSNQELLDWPRLRILGCTHTPTG